MTSFLRRVVYALLPILLCAISLFGQEPAKLRVHGAGLTPAEFTVADFAHLPRLSVKVENSHTKQTEEYSGVRISDLLLKTGAPLGEKLHGQAMATYVVAHASDGYTVVYSLAELDPALNGNEIIVADTKDGKGLDSKQGPFQVIIPGDKRPVRWIRMLTDLEVSSAANSATSAKP